MFLHRSIILFHLACAAATGQSLDSIFPTPALDAPLSEQKFTENISLPKIGGKDLGLLYQKLTGRRVLVSAAAAEAEFSFVQDASVEDPLTYPEAAELVKKAAVMENCVFVKDNQNPNLDILTFSKGGNTRCIKLGPTVFTENDALPEKDAIISYVMTLNYITPHNAIELINKRISKFSEHGSIAGVPNASALVITEKTSVIRKIIELKKEIDKR